MQQRANWRKRAANATDKTGGCGTGDLMQVMTDVDTPSVATPCHVVMPSPSTSPMKPLHAVLAYQVGMNTQ
jgi:hypothetical protein